MKKIKKGFSLAEILIALGIISVIATACFSIANRGIDRAYSMYIYTGYKGISNAIADANAYGYNIDPNNVSGCSFSRHIYKILSGTNETPTVNPWRFDTPNGTRYTISFAGSRTPTGMPELTKNFYYITMETPARKRNTSIAGSRNVICLAYMPDDEYGILIPFDRNGNQCVSTIANIQDRADLLPFYIDDGFVGRTLNGAYRPKMYRSIKDAICNAYGTNVVAVSTIVTCPAGSKTTTGAVKVENPQKAWGH